jgi:hypothetical protein
MTGPNIAVTRAVDEEVGQRRARREVAVASGAAVPRRRDPIRVGLRASHACPAGSVEEEQLHGHTHPGPWVHVAWGTCVEQP